eukprot:305005-Rhodomonas_salina.1
MADDKDPSPQRWPPSQTSTGDVSASTRLLVTRLWSTLTSIIIDSPKDHCQRLRIRGHPTRIATMLFEAWLTGRRCTRRCVRTLAMTWLMAPAEYPALLATQES